MTLLFFYSHNWGDAEATKILRNLREASTSQSKLVLHEFLLDYMCEDPDTAAYRIPGVRRAKPAPKPLLPNFGAGDALPFHVDMQVSPLETMCN